MTVTWIRYNSSLHNFPMPKFPLIVIISCPLYTVPLIKMVKRPTTSPYTSSLCSSISLRSAEVSVGKRYEMTSTMSADRRDLTHRGHSLIFIFTSFISVFSPSSSCSLSFSLSIFLSLSLFLTLHLPLALSLFFLLHLSLALSLFLSLFLLLRPLAPPSLE